MTTKVCPDLLQRARLAEARWADECDARTLVAWLQMRESGIHCCIDGLERRGRHVRTDEIARWT
jgi:hypothetical protein